MHPRTMATFYELDKVTWFTRVGTNDTQSAIVLPNWQEALAHCGSTEWQDLLLEAANRYSERVAERSKERFNKWNAVVAEVKKASEPFVQRKIRNAVQDNKLPSIFEQTVQWDVLHAFLEAEYADVYETGFYASQMYWYANGHFPCGWKGKFPDGVLRVF